MVVPLFCQSDDDDIYPKYNTLEHMAFDFDGHCDSKLIEEGGCLPIRNFSFSKIWEEYPPEKIKEIVNKMLSENSNYNGKILANIDENGKLALFAKEAIEKEELLGTLSLKESLSVSNVNFNLFSSDFHILQKYKNGLPPLSIPHNDRAHEKFFNLMLNLLLHLHNIEYSKIKAVILMLPQNLDNYELFKFTPYEIEMIFKGDEIQTQINNLYNYYKIGFQLFKETMLNSWAQETIVDLFHREDFLYQDFIYCLTLYIFGFYNEMLPGIFFGTQGKIVNKTNSPYSYHYLNKTALDFELMEEAEMLNLKQIQVKAQKKFEKGEKIILDYNGDKALNYFLSGLFNGEEDTLEAECIDFFIFSEEEAKKYNEKDHFCVYRELLFHYYVFNNFVNLIGNDYSECNKVIKTLPYRNFTFDKEKDELIYKNCVHPEWKSDYFSFMELQLEERHDNILHVLRKIDDYYEFRLEKHLPTRRVELIKKYFKLRMKVVKILKQEIKKYRKINKENRNKKIQKEEL